METKLDELFICFCSAEQFESGTIVGRWVNVAPLVTEQALEVCLELLLDKWESEEWIIIGYGKCPFSFEEKQPEISKLIEQIRKYSAFC